MPSAHSKRNTSLAFFTSYERSLLRTAWGSQSSRLTRDSFLPYGSCQLCLLPSRDPVACPQGDMFCRECAMSNLLAQRKEIARLEREWERQVAEGKEKEVLDEAEETERAVLEFEKVQMGLEGAKPILANSQAKEQTQPKKGTKRDFELDDDELLRIATDERKKMRTALDSEKKAEQKHLPSFWVPSETPNTDSQAPTSKPPKLQALCPCSSDDKPHVYSLKTLASIHFSTERDPNVKDLVRTCPACRKALSNSTKSVLAVPCGHVLCKPCADKFLKASGDPDPHDPEATDGAVRCYVCEADLSPLAAEAKGSTKDKSKKKGKREKDGMRPGIIQLKSDGTGFAGGGKSLVEKHGISFQC